MKQFTIFFAIFLSFQSVFAIRGTSKARALFIDAIAQGKKNYKIFSKKFREVEKKLNYHVLFSNGFTEHEVTILEGSGFDIDGLVSLVLNPKYEGDTDFLRERVFSYVVNHHIVSPVTLRWWNIAAFRNRIFDHIEKHHLVEDKDLFLKWFREDQTRKYPPTEEEDFYVVCNRLGIGEQYQTFYLNHWKRDIHLVKPSKLKEFIDSSLEQAIVSGDSTLLSRDPFWKMLQVASRESEELVNFLEYTHRTSFMFMVFYMRFIG